MGKLFLLQKCKISLAFFGTTYVLEFGLGVCSLVAQEQQLSQSGRRKPF